MFFGEFISGAILMLYQNKYVLVKKDEKKKKYFMSIELLQNDKEDEDYFVPLDDQKKILFLIFVSAFFDVFQYLLYIEYLPKYSKISESINTRLSGISSISA